METVVATTTDQASTETALTEVVMASATDTERAAPWASTATVEELSVDADVAPSATDTATTRDGEQQTTPVYTDSETTLCLK